MGFPKYTVLIKVYFRIRSNLWWPWGWEWGVRHRQRMGCFLSVLIFLKELRNYVSWMWLRFKQVLQKSLTLQYFQPCFSHLSCCIESSRSHKPTTALSHIFLDCKAFLDGRKNILTSLTKWHTWSYKGKKASAFIIKKLSRYAHSSFKYTIQP